MNEIIKIYFNKFSEKDTSWYSDEYTLRINEYNEILDRNPSKLKSEESIDNRIDLLQVLDLGVKNSHFTNFGKKHYKEILQILIEIIRTNELQMNNVFPRKFFDFGKYYKTSSNSNRFDPSLYMEYFDDIPHYVKNFKTQMKREGVPLYPTSFPLIVELVIQNYFKKEIREAENIFRLKRDMPKVGEGWISETELYYEIKRFFSNNTVIQHARPSWLGRQHFDVYFPKENIAIEYQGIQHSEPVEYFGGTEAYKVNLENDKRKKEKARLNKCVLIEVFPNYDFKEVKLRIEQELENRNTTNNS